MLQNWMRTYYPRSCTRENLTTGDYRNLMVLLSDARGDNNIDVAAVNAAMVETAAETVLTHGVAIFPRTLDRRLADSFCDYTLRCNRALNDSDQVYAMNARNSQRQM